MSLPCVDTCAHVRKSVNLSAGIFICLYTTYQLPKLPVSLCNCLLFYLFYVSPAIGHAVLQLQDVKQTEGIASSLQRGTTGTHGGRRNEMQRKFIQDALYVHYLMNRFFHMPWRKCKILWITLYIIWYSSIRLKKHTCA